MVGIPSCIVCPDMLELVQSVSIKTEEFCVKKEIISTVLSVLLIIAVLCGCQKQTGWVEKDGNTYYYLEDGSAATGWLELDGSHYHFSSDGHLEKGFREIDGETFYFRADGTQVSGWLELDGKLFYLRQSGSLVTGWLSLDGQRYYLTEDGAATGICTVDGSTYVFDCDGRLTSGWATLENGTAFGDLNFHPVSGWQEIDGQRYYFTEDGMLQTGWAEIDGFTYCFEEDGTPVQGITPIGQFAASGQLVILVNPWNYVPENYTVELKEINEYHQVAAVAYGDMAEMLTDCENAGHQPVVCSSYRTQEYQEGLFQRKIERLLEEEDNDYTEEEARTVAARSVAIPGTSEHQLGLALDIIDNRNWNLDESQARMPTQQWLMENSWRYGWILRYPDEKSEITGIIYEPWHYRYVGREVAAEIHELDVCLEEYLMMLTTGVG